MKTLKLLSLLLFVPLVFHAQKSLTGLWIGTLSNDSTTVRKDQSFEIALTQYKGKVYGYSRMNFIVNDTLYYIVKRIKGTIENDVCEVKDDDIISHNFPRKPDKGVRLISTFRRNLQDSIWRLDGDWKTTESKKHRYYSISGKISLTSEPDISKSKIFPHLEELNLANDVAFYKESKINDERIAAANQKAPAAETKIAAVNKKEEKKQTEATITKTEPQKSPALTSTAIVTGSKSDITTKASATEVKKQEAVAKKDEAVQVSEDVVASTGIRKSGAPASNMPTEQKKDVTGTISKPDIKNQAPDVKINEPIATISEAKTETKKIDPSTVAKTAEQKKDVITGTSQPEFKLSSAAAFVGQRKTVAPQIVEFKSDSLELKLYDNGEIDGDTVSVLLNGELLLAKQGLKAAAIKKTIYIQPGSDEITLVLYAENLGKYPPNTGLLIVHDGEDVYQVRFSADLQRNAAVVLRRKK